MDGFTDFLGIDNDISTLENNFNEKLRDIQHNQKEYNNQIVKKLDQIFINRVWKVLDINKEDVSNTIFFVDNSNGFLTFLIKTLKTLGIESGGFDFGGSGTYVIKDDMLQKFEPHPTIAVIFYGVTGKSCYERFKEINIKKYFKLIESNRLDMIIKQNGT